MLQALRHRVSAALRQTAAMATLILAATLPNGAHAADAKADYIIGPGDVVRVNVYQNPDLTLETRVSESGTISYPLLGSVKLGGLSIAEAEKTIATGLLKGNFLRQPQVNLLLLQIRGNQASVLGMVNKPGRYPIEVTGLRLSELLATAGGIAPAGSDTATLVGVRGGKQFRKQIDIGLLLMEGNERDDPTIENGDTVYVDRMPMVYVYGQVQRPGSMRVERGMTVMQVLANGGGLTARGTEKNIKLHRRTADGKVAEREAPLSELVKDGDVLFVRESLF
jgi:polysaccharide export outer membrane protein